MTLRWKALFRDTLVVVVLASVGTYALLFVPALISSAGGFVATRLLFLTLGFTISGCLVRSQRFSHVFAVALVVWLIGLPGLLAAHTTFLTAVFFSLALFVAAAVGAGLSFLIVRRPPPHPDVHGEPAA